MFEYSTYAYGVVGPSYIGVTVSIALYLIYWWMSFGIIYDNIAEHPKKTILIGVIIPVLLFGFSVYRSVNGAVGFDCGQHQEKVVAKFESFLPEVYKERSGKHDVERHKMYAQYSVGNDRFVIAVDNLTSLSAYSYFYRVNVSEYPVCSKKN